MFSPSRNLKYNVLAPAHTALPHLCPSPSPDGPMPIVQEQRALPVTPLDHNLWQRTQLLRQAEIWVMKDLPGQGPVETKKRAHQAALSLSMCECDGGASLTPLPHLGPQSEPREARFSLLSLTMVVIFFLKIFATWSNWEGAHRDPLTLLSPSSESCVSLRFNQRNKEVTKQSWSRSGPRPVIVK